MKMTGPMSPKSDEKGCCVHVEMSPKDAASLTLGDKITVKVTGTVGSLAKYGAAENVNVSLDNSTVQMESNRADASFRKLTGAADSLPTKSVGKSGRHANDADRSMADIKGGFERDF